jgi:hypothetical protein
MRASRYGLLVRLNRGKIDADNLGLGVSVGWMSRVSGGWRGQGKEVVPKSMAQIPVPHPASMARFTCLRGAWFSLSFKVSHTMWCWKSVVCQSRDVDLAESTHQNALVPPRKGECQHQHRDRRRQAW